MYGFLLATYKAGLTVHEHEHILAHPPWDAKPEIAGDPVYLLHFTYPVFFAANGSMTFEKNESVWTFQKRDYSEHPPPKNLVEPPANVDHDLMRKLIRMFNEATASIPCWDDYIKTSKAACST
jgi:hypothetical protein